MSESVQPGEAERCQKCGGKNPSWHASSPLWNYVMRGNDINGEPLFGDMVCIGCFIQLAELTDLTPGHYWQLNIMPEPVGLVYETPSGRVWNAGQMLWDQP